MLLLSALQALSEVREPERKGGKKKMSIEDFIVREILNSHRNNSDSSKKVSVPASNVVGTSSCAQSSSGGSGGPYNTTAAILRKTEPPGESVKSRLTGIDNQGRGDCKDNDDPSGKQQREEHSTKVAGTTTSVKSNRPFFSHVPTTNASGSSVASASTNNITSSSTSSSGDVVPKATDVLCGRGRGVGSKPGNVFYNDLISQKRKAYRKLEKKDKQGYAAVVLREIEGKGGRFLYEENGKWKVLDERRILEKICTALRKDSKKKIKPGEARNDGSMTGSDLQDEEMECADDGDGDKDEDLQDHVENDAEDESEHKCATSSSGASSRSENDPASFGCSQGGENSRLPAKKRHLNKPSLPTTAATSFQTSASPSSFKTAARKSEGDSRLSSKATTRETQDMSPQIAPFGLAALGAVTNSSDLMEAVACGMCLRRTSHCTCGAARPPSIKEAAAAHTERTSPGSDRAADMSTTDLPVTSSGTELGGQPLGVGNATSNLSSNMSAALSLLEAHRQSQRQQPSAGANPGSSEVAVALLAEIERRRQNSAAAAAIIAAAGLPQGTSAPPIGATGFLPSAPIRSLGPLASAGDVLSSLMFPRQQNQPSMNLSGGIVTPIQSLPLLFRPQQPDQLLSTLSSQTTNTQNTDDSETGAAMQSSMLIDFPRFTSQGRGTMLGAGSPDALESAPFSTIRSLGRTKAAGKPPKELGDDFIGSDVKYCDAEEENVPVQLRQFRYDCGSCRRDKEAKTEN